MSELAFTWVTLRASERARRLLTLGLALTGAAFLAALAAVSIAPSPGRGLAALAVLIVLIGAGRHRRGGGGAMRLRVTAQAEILARTDSCADPRPLQVWFVAPWLIVVGDRDATVPVWPDRLGANEYRRLAVACRWRRCAA